MSLGLTQEDFENESMDSVGIFPDNLGSVNVFIAMSTQWRMGQMGPIGLDYNVLPLVCDLLNVDKEKRAEIFDDLRHLEDAALTEMRAK